VNNVESFSLNIKEGRHAVSVRTRTPLVHEQARINSSEAVLSLAN
jgi:hypothetical protein